MKKINQKKICFITDYNSIDSTLNTHKYLINKLISNFSNVYFINSKYFEIFSENKDYKIKNNNKNIHFLKIKNKKDFKKFFENNNCIIINNFGKKFEELYLHYLIKKNKIKQIQILNTDPVSYTRKPEKIVSSLKHSFSRVIISQLTTILAICNIISKIDICFTTKKYLIKQQKNKIRKNFRFVKKYILINCLAHDDCKDLKFKKSTKHILYIDYSVNHEDCVSNRGILNEQIVKKHYQRVKKFLDKIKKIYKQNIIISIHPAYSLYETKKNIPGYKVIKHQTIKLISKASLIIFFNSTVLTYGFLMRKKMINLKSPILGKNSVSESNLYPHYSGVPIFDINNEFKLTKPKLNKLLNSSKNKNELFVKKHLQPDNNNNGVDKVIKYLIKYNFSN